MNVVTVFLSFGYLGNIFQLLQGNSLFLILSSAIKHVENLARLEGAKMIKCNKTLLPQFLSHAL